MIQTKIKKEITMNEKKAEIIAKIQKIMLKANSTEGTPEGDTFKRHAALMMAKYRIEESEIDLETANVIMNQLKFYEDGGKIPEWISDVITGFGWCFDTNMVFRTNKYANPIEQEWDIIGTFSDVETVVYFSEVVINHIETAGWKEFPETHKSKKRNQLGNVAASVIRNRLMDLKKEMDVTIHEDKGCTAIVISKEKMVQEVVDKEYPNLKSAKRYKKDIPTDNRTIMAGITAGETAPMNFGIED